MNNSEQMAAANEGRRNKSLFWEYAQSILIAVLIALFVRTFVIQAFKIPSSSMEDTLAVGDQILVNKFIYGTKIPFTDASILKLRNPERGDVIVFEYPQDPTKDFIKRIIGIPGDVIEIKDKRVFINGKPYDNPHAVHKDGVILSANEAPRDNIAAITVPNNDYFVMGDNRDNSYDSRFWGFVQKNKIKGLAIIKFWSWDKDNFRIRWGNIGRLIS